MNYVTIHLSDGRKITKDIDNLIFFIPRISVMPMAREGCITINVDHIVDMRPAEKDEIEHAKIHGW